MNANQSVESNTYPGGGGGGGGCIYGDLIYFADLYVAFVEVHMPVYLVLYTVILNI